MYYVNDTGTVTHVARSGDYTNVTDTESTMAEPTRFINYEFVRQENDYDWVVETDPVTDICYLYAYSYISSGGG